MSPLERARALLPLAHRMRALAKSHADALTPLDRRFGDRRTRHLARLLDDAWMACDSLISDVESDDGGSVQATD